MAMKNTRKKIKVKSQYDLPWNKFVQKFPQTIQGLLNFPTVTQHLYNGLLSHLSFYCLIFNRQVQFRSML